MNMVLSLVMVVKGLMFIPGVCCFRHSKNEYHSLNNAIWKQLKPHVMACSRLKWSYGIFFNFLYIMRMNNDQFSVHQKTKS